MDLLFYSCHWSHSHTTLAKLSAKRQEVLSPAGNIVEQTIVQIRVVLGCWHLLGENRALQGYSSALRIAQQWLRKEHGCVPHREILSDGNDVKSLKLKWLRQQIGLVNQELALFAITIRENMLLERSDADQVEIEEATRVANAHSFIIKLPEDDDL
ncbi:ABC transporter B family member [Arachis hypogaea]|uniref:ABC transporter B family member n=1 Tax=Arachis hypogaea TaxID=3818 RepID=A0A6B9V6Z8_ARAHY|nr:ABC transporter B family member [Arachis hypogaea]